MPKKNIRPTAARAQAPVAPTGSQIPPAAHAVLALLDPLSGTTAAGLAERAGLGRSTVTKALAKLSEARLVVRKPGGHEGSRKIADLWFAAAVTAAAIDRPETADEVPDGPGSVDEQPAELAAGFEVSAEKPEPGGTEAVADAPEEEPGARGNAIGTEPMADGGQPGADPASSSAHAGTGTAHEQEATGQEPARATPARLGKGELRDQVERHLRENPDRAWTASAIAKVLDRSAGAIKNAGDKLVTLGSAITFEDTPTRYQHSGDR